MAGVAPYKRAVIYQAWEKKTRHFGLARSGPTKTGPTTWLTYLATDERLDSLRTDPRFCRPEEARRAAVGW